MEFLQKGLVWLYILICFAIIIYTVSVLMALWRWIRTRRGGRDAAWSSAKYEKKRPDSASPVAPCRKT